MSKKSSEEMVQSWEYLSEQIRGFLHDEYPKATDDAVYVFFVSGVEKRFLEELLENHEIVGKMDRSEYRKLLEEYKARIKEMKDEIQKI